MTAQAAAAQKRPKQKQLAGMEDKHDPAVAKAAIALLEATEAKKSAGKTVKAAEEKLGVRVEVTEKAKIEVERIAADESGEAEA